MVPGQSRRPVAERGREDDYVLKHEKLSFFPPASLLGLEDWTETVGFAPREWPRTDLLGEGWRGRGRGRLSVCPLPPSGRTPIESKCEREQLRCGGESPGRAVRRGPGTWRWRKGLEAVAVAVAVVLTKFFYQPLVGGLCVELFCDG